MKVKVVADPYGVALEMASRIAHLSMGLGLGYILHIWIAN